MSEKSVLHKALAHCIDNRLTFAAFRTPGQPVQLWAQRTPDLETVDGTLLLELNQVFLVAPFDLDREKVPFIRADIELMFPEIDPDISSLEECEGAPEKEQGLGTATPKAEFIDSVIAAKQACKSRTISKAVISRVMDVTLRRRPATGAIRSGHQCQRGNVRCHGTHAGAWVVDGCIAGAFGA
jgi:hypothetical protein